MDDIASARGAREKKQRTDRVNAASIETFDASTRKFFDVLMTSYRQLMQAARDIDLALAASHQASAECRALGEVVSDLGPHHLVRGVVLANFEAHPDRARGLLELLLPTALVGRLANGLASAVAVPLLEQLGGAVPRTMPDPQTFAEIRALFAERTLAERRAGGAS